MKFASRTGAAAGLALAACALPQSGVPGPDGTILQATRDPMQYRSPQPRDAHGAGPPQVAYGEACRTMLTFPISPPTVFIGSRTAAQVLPWSPLAVTAGDDGYIKAMERAERSVDGARLYDVRADLHTTAILSILRFECVEIHALAAR